MEVPTVIALLALVLGPAGVIAWAMSFNRADSRAGVETMQMIAHELRAEVARLTTECAGLRNQVLELSDECHRLRAQLPPRVVAVPGSRSSDPPEPQSATLAADMIFFNRQESR